MAARRIVSTALGAMLLLASGAFAQEFDYYVSKEDLFAARFPGIPVVTNIMWETEYGAKIPARVYTVTVPASQGTRKYVVTAVNYGPVRQIQEERAKSCFPGDERCTGNSSFPGAGYWKNDTRGAMIYAAAKYIKNADYRVTHYAWSEMGVQAVENNEMQMVNTKDKSRTYVNIMMHHSMLYIMEETTPPGYPPPGPLVQSMSLKESDGSNARHYGVYFNGATIDPVEARTCSNGGIESPDYPPCETLPAAVRFKQGPDFSLEDTKGLKAPRNENIPSRSEREK